jgi:DNA-binding transcriptional MerR regulator
MELSIGKLAKLAGVKIDTVRYYERNGLLAPSTRLASGYRRYGDLELARLRFIRRAQKLGFSLKEINSLLSLSARRNVAQVKRSAQAKLADVEARIADLQRVGVLREDDRILFRNALVLPYANVIFDLERASSLAIVHGYLDELGIGYCGRYGDWGYMWTDESFMSGERAAESTLACCR